MFARMTIPVVLVMVLGAQARAEEAAKVKPDFSTPKAAIQTFIAAALARDTDLLSTCFHSKAPAEFAPFVKKTASKKQLDGFAEFFQGAEITSVEDQGERAVVKVKLKTRDESISLGKAATGWKVIDF
ncbi:MAG: hypothetical protein SFU86_23445 [Pirellulaceae bacterium]|nr:hypothetical protein [Pirellulaceae bacterium]